MLRARGTFSRSLFIPCGCLVIAHKSKISESSKKMGMSWASVARPPARAKHPAFPFFLWSELYAPSLWQAEIVSTLRKMIFTGQITPGNARSTINDLVRLLVTIMQADEELLLSSLKWVERTGQMVAYDTQYIALAEYLGVELWTADQKLYHHLAVDLPWLHWVGET